MNRHLILMFAAMLLLGLRGGVAAVTMNLLLEPQRTIPGIPVVLNVKIFNDSSLEYHVPGKAILHVAAGETQFDAIASSRTDYTIGSFGEGAASKVISPMASGDFSYWDAFAGPSWLCDRRLMQPGTYKLRLEVFEPGDDSSTLTSNEATLVVEEPQGSEAELWKELSKDDPGCFWPSSMTPGLWNKYHPTRYTQFAIPPASTADDDVELAYFDKAIAVDPSAPVADLHRLSKATIEVSKLNRAIIDRKLEDALGARSRAESLAKSVASHALDPLLRVRAVSLLADGVPPAEQVRREIGLLDGAIPQEIDAGAICTTALPSGKSRIYFGYAQGLNRDVVLEIGNENKFTPPPFDRGQPRVFKYGLFRNAFTIETDEPHLTWHLQTQGIQIDVKSLPPCPEGYPENLEKQASQ